MDYTPELIASALDYAVLSPLAMIKDIRDGAAFCNKHKLKSFCVASANVEIAASMFDNVSSVVGFPHGNSSPHAKYEEGAKAIWDGAKELDVVINYGRFLGGDSGIIHKELNTLCILAATNGVLVKAILESCHYTLPRLADACKRCVDAGVHFVKTSTGFGPGPATPGDVQIMLDAVRGTEVFVKASGGIKTYADVQCYLDLGCMRLGASRYLELLP